MFDILFQIGVGLRGKRFEQGAVDIAFEDCRMNVAAPADRRRVAEMLRDLLDGAHDRLLPLALGSELAKTPQRLRRELRAGPGAEVFCGDILPCYLALTGFNILRAHRMLIASVVQLL